MASPALGDVNVGRGPPGGDWSLFELLSGDFPGNA